MKILLVDDDNMITDCLSKSLIRKGHTVVCCWNGLNGLYQFENAGPWDIVISDWNMPVMNGDVMVRKILTLNPQQKVVMMTGDWSNKPPEGVRMLRKPFDRSELLEAIEWVSTTTA